MPRTARSSFPAALIGIAVILPVSCAAPSGSEAIEARRARYSAELGGFVVRDEADGSRQVLLDVLVRSEAKEPLDGVTLDISVAGADGKERERHRIWVDTTGVGPGGAQMAIALDDVDYRPGDGFWVEVRSPVPPAERSEYREFGAGS